MEFETVAAFRRRHLSKARPMFETQDFLTSNRACTIACTRGMAATGYRSNATGAPALEGEHTMNKMLVAVFDTEPAAFEGLQALKDLHRDGDITLYATAVLVKDFSGAVSVQQTADVGPLGTAVGMLTGSATGLLAGEAGAAAGLAAGAIAGPIGVAVGFSLGALTGLMIDLSHSGVNVDFVDEVSKAMIPGKAAVVAEV